MDGVVVRRPPAVVDSDDAAAEARCGAASCSRVTVAHLDGDGDGDDDDDGEVVSSETSSMLVGAAVPREDATAAFVLRRRGIV